ncbi:MAG TPA: S8/S53 family peptidase [Candidatus Thermoplasmatota archaeon]|nr:S8/S53 family peptidase [Candidatus Thermoplasmatota archaeon]
MSRMLALLALGSLLLAGCVSPAAQLQPLAGPPLVAERPSVVIAVIDTGINFYHAEYRLANEASPLAAASPEALARLGVPELSAVPLSLDAKDWKAAVKQDKETLMKMEPKTLYTFPGTRILGAISFYERDGDWPIILDRPGYYTHGTMTSSRAVGNTVSIGGAEPDIYLVMVQGFTPEAVRWVADQDWIDIASISAGLSFFPVAPGVATVGEAAGLSDAIGAYNYLAHRKPFFASTGNGVGNAGLLGFPSWLRGASGAPNVISVGANNNGQMSHWHNQDPYISADGCANPAARADKTEEVSNNGGGTSSATPFSAGGGAKLLLEARRILQDLHVGPRVDDTLAEEGWTSQRAADATVVLARGEPGLVPDGPLADGVFTLSEFKRTLYMTALAVPTDDESDGNACMPFAGGFPGGEALPPEARFPIHGYGEVNAESIKAAIAVIQGEAPMPERPADDAQYEQAHHRKMVFVGDEE